MAIITGEYPPDVGLSGIARCLSIELEHGDIDTTLLLELQAAAADGTLSHCMRAYIDYLQKKHLCTPVVADSFVADLRVRFNAKRSAYIARHRTAHGRVVEAVVHLEIAMEEYLGSLLYHRAITAEFRDYFMETFKTEMDQLLLRQAARVTDDKPTLKFIQKLSALLESGRAVTLPRHGAGECRPVGFVGYEDSTTIISSKTLPTSWCDGCVMSGANSLPSPQENWLKNWSPRGLHYLIWIKTPAN